MNTLLLDLKREREERERNAAANAGGCPETGEGTASGKVQEADSASGVSEGSSRKRKQSAPQRIIRDPAQEAQGSSATERAASQEVGSEKEGGSSKSEKVDPPKKRSRPSQPAQASQGTFTGDFDAEHMAACIVSGTLFAGRQSRGEVRIFVSLCAC
jgi:hypothetical protein